MMTAGPTPVPEFVLSAMAESVQYHRGESFAQVVENCRKELPKIFGTKEEVLIFSGSGTLAMEGAICNFFNAGDEVISVNSGKFGQRWSDQAKIYGCTVKEIFVERGSAVELEEIKKLLNSKTRGILIHASETSTGVRHDIKAIAELAHKEEDCLCLVDGVTAVGVFQCPMDTWGIDVLIAGSQKGFILPPGLSFGAASARAWKRSEEITAPRYYLDWRKEKKSIQKNTSAFTSAVTLVGGLERVLKYMAEVGHEAIYQRSWKYSFAARECLKKMGIELLVKEDHHASAACTAFMTEGLISNKSINAKYAMMISGGQDELKGKILRLGHIGYMDGWDLFNQLNAVAQSFILAGKKINRADANELFFEILENDINYTPKDLLL